MMSVVMNMGAARKFSAELTRSVGDMENKPAFMLGLKAVWHEQHQHLALMNTMNITSTDCLFHIRCVLLLEWGFLGNAQFGFWKAVAYIL
jgi:hypothetical protein